MGPRARRFQLDLDHPNSQRKLHFPNKPGRGGDPSANVADHYTEVLLNDPHSIYWRGQVGSFIAEQLGHDLLQTGAWHVANWPYGYSMWKTERQASTKGPRSDYYLVGYGGRKKFASPQEFAFHAMWLYDDDYHEFGQCECTLCTGRSQGAINAEWEEDGPAYTTKRSRGGGSGGGGGGGGGGGRRGGSGREREQDPQPIDDYDGPMADLPHQPKVAPWVRHKKLFGGSRAIVSASPEREDDVSVHLRTLPLAERALDLKTRRPFRNDELVWVAIPRIRSPDTNSTDGIELWPAISKDVEGQGKNSVYLLGVGTTHIVPVGSILSWQSIPLVQPPQYKDAWQGAAKGSRRVTPFNHGIRPWDNDILAAFAAAVFAATSVVLHHNSLILDDQESCQGIWWGAENIWVGDMVQIIPDERDIRLQDYLDGVGIDKDAVQLYGRITEIEARPGGQRAEARIWARIYTLGQVEPGDDGYTESLPYPLPKPPSKYEFRLTSKKDIRVGIYSIAGRYDPLPLTSQDHNRILRRIAGDGKFLRTMGSILGYDGGQSGVGALLKDVKSLLNKEIRSGAWVVEKTNWKPRRQMLEEADRRSREWLQGHLVDSDDSDDDVVILD